MSIHFDRFSRTFITSIPSEGVTVRTHTQHAPIEYVRNNRQRMRRGAKEVLTILSRAGMRMTFDQIKAAIPGITSSTLQVRLSSLTSRQDIERHGSKGQYRYSLPMSSTFCTT